MESNLIQVSGLSKSYGDHLVLDGLTFSLPEGEIVGLFGPNGCGKTTLLKIMSGLIHDYKGSVLIDGKTPGEETKAFCAYLPEQTFVHDWMRNIDAVDYFADFFGDFDKNKALEMIKRFGLPLKQKSKTMSKGMQEKMQLLLVMSREAQLYILDEPLGGVDPVARDFIMETIMKNHLANSTILLSTHLIYDIEGILDRVLMVKGGSLAVNTDVKTISEHNMTVEDLFKEVFRNVM